MPHNEVDQMDYMAEEGDMSDFADDVDEEENGGDDQNLDDYDMVSLISFFSIELTFGWFSSLVY